MSQRRSGSRRLRDRAIVAAVVAAVVFAGIGTVAVGGSSASGTGDAADWSPHPGKEVTPDNETTCPVGYEPVAGNDTNNTTTDSSTNASGYELHIIYSGDWEATIVTEDADVPVEGSGNSTVSISADKDEYVSAVVTKSDFNEDLMTVQLLYNGEVVGQEQRLDLASVDNYNMLDSTVGSTYNDTSADTTSADTTSADTTSADTTFRSTTTTDSFNDTTASTDSGWATFGDENGTSSFGSDAVAGNSNDPFATTENSDAGYTDSAFNNSSANDGGPFATTANTDEANATNTTNATNQADVPNGCVPVGNDTNTTNDSSIPLSTNGSAQVTLGKQDTEGTSVTVDSATLPDGGFVVIHDMSLLQGGDVEGSVLGVSDRLDAQQSMDVKIPLARGINESQTVVAVVYRDSDGNGEFGYNESGAADEPYTDDNDSVVNDEAYVTVLGAGNGTTESGPFDTTSTDTFGTDTTSTATTAQDSVFEDGTTTGTATPSATSATPTPNAAMSGAAEQSTETNAPGFGIVAALVALLGGALLATRVR